MPSYMMLNLQMQRESNSTPWGFRMQGGRDFGCPLQIQKVNPGSLAERCGIQVNDYIVKIGTVPTDQMKHQDAQEQIKQQNNLLELTLQRGAPPDANDYHGQVQFPPPQLMDSTSTQTTRPAQPPTPQVAMPITNNRALLSQAHNTPIGLYSADNVTEAITRTLKSSPPSSRLNSTKADNSKSTAPPVLKSSDVQDLQQKYLYLEREMNNGKSESRQGPAFRALVRGLDEGEDATSRSTVKSNPTPPQHIDSNKIKGFRYMNHQSMNVASEYKIEEPKNYNEFKTYAARSMGKPISSPPPFNPPPPAPQPIVRPPPLTTQSKSTTNKSPTNGTTQEKSRSGNRMFTKGNKGTALLNRNENTNQVAKCHACGILIRGPYISAIGHCFCVDHFTCSKCSVNLIDSGFVEENGKLYCERDFEQYLAPQCSKCSQSILKECVHAMEKTYHPECFTCAACKKTIGTGSFHVEEGQPYCVEDYRQLFQVKCTGCDFPIEPGDKYLEAMGGTFHVECFNCSMCQVSLNGQPFIIKNDRPYCRLHAR